MTHAIAFYQIVSTVADGKKISRIHIGRFAIVPCTAIIHGVVENLVVVAYPLQWQIPPNPEHT